MSVSGTAGPMGRGLLAAQAAWILVLLLALTITGVSAPILFEQYGTVCTLGPETCFERSRLTPEELRGLEGVGISLGLYAALTTGVGVLSKLVWISVGALVFALRPDDRMALLVAFFLVSFGAATFMADSVEALVLARSAWWVPARGLQALGEVFVVLFFLTFPDGRFVPRWTPLLAAAFLIFQIPSDLYPGIYSGAPALEVTQSVVFVGFVLSMLGSQVFRYRNVSTAHQRRQTRWVVFGTTLALSLLIALLAPIFWSAPKMAEVSPFVLFLIGNVIPLVMLLVPLSVGVAVLRSGLFDIDRVINRALVYATLTAALIFVYVGSVVVLQRAFGSLTGGDSQLVVVASTLAIAALFGPLRRCIQAFIDRRFYRNKYDAAKTLQEFSARLRDETDLDLLGEDLLGVTRETVQPSHASLWLRSWQDRAPRDGAEVRVR